MPKKFQIEAHFHGKESGDTLLIVQVENVDIICSSWCVPTDMLLEDRNRGARDLIVSHPLMAEIDRLQTVINNVDEQLKAVNKQGEGTLIAQMIDTDFLKQTVLEARNDLRTKASQRITALGQMGCGKSTTLNMMLCSSVLDIGEYIREWSEAFPCGIQETAPDVFTLQYFADSVRFLPNHYMIS